MKQVGTLVAVCDLWYIGVGGAEQPGVAAGFSVQPI